MPESLDDTHWIALARQGDHHAFSQLVLRHQALVRAFLLSRLSRKHEAEDLAQETFVTAWRKLADFDTARPLVPWLRGIAENHLRNHLRKFKESPIGGDEALQAMLDHELSHATETPPQTPRIDALSSCLAALDGPSKTLLQARYVEGKSMIELTWQTGRKHSALTMQLHRLRHLLAECVTRKIANSNSEA
jgi:RNA polymerase sigma-70 factor (ECF subfamily)